MPAAGGFSQTAVNQQSGARSQLSGPTTAVLAVLAALFLAPVLDDLPEATLGALVIVATLGLVSVPDFLRLARINRVELVVAAVTAAVGLFAGLLAAVALGVALTLALVLRELDRPDCSGSTPRALPPDCWRCGSAPRSTRPTCAPSSATSSPWSTRRSQPGGPRRSSSST